MTTAAHRPIAAAVGRLLEGWREGRSLAEISGNLGREGFGLLALTLALPCVLPLPFVGAPALAGIVLILVALQVAADRGALWLPQWLARRPLAGRGVAARLEAVVPRIAAFEAWTRPRLAVLSSVTMRRLSGAFMATLALVMALPIPMGNPPLAVALALLAGGLINRDGLLILGAWLCGGAALAFNLSLLAGYGWLAARFLDMVG